MPPSCMASLACSSWNCLSSISLSSAALISSSLLLKCLSTLAVKVSILEKAPVSACMVKTVPIAPIAMGTVQRMYFLGTFEQMRMMNEIKHMIRVADTLPMRQSTHTTPRGARIFSAYSLKVLNLETSIVRARYRTTAIFATSDGCMLTPAISMVLRPPVSSGTASSSILAPMSM